MYVIGIVVSGFIRNISKGPKLRVRNTLLNAEFHFLRHAISFSLIFFTALMISFDEIVKFPED